MAFDVSNSIEDHFVENKSLLEYSKLNDGTSHKPCSLALSEFHFLLLYENGLKVCEFLS